MAMLMSGWSHREKRRNVIKKCNTLLFVSLIIFLASCKSTSYNENSKSMEMNTLKNSYMEKAQEQLLNRVREKTKEPVCIFFYMDNHPKEDSYAFVYTGEKTEEPAETTFHGSLWYVDNRECVLLMDEIDTSIFEPVILEENKHLLFQTGSKIPGDVKSYIWAVITHKPQLVLDTSSACFVDNGRLANVKTEISISAGGRIWKRYYLYWNSDEQSYQTYMGTRITEERFLSYHNAENVRDYVEAAIKKEIAGSGFPMADMDNEVNVEYDYIKCDNGILYVNYIIACDSNVFYYYSILVEKEGEVILEKRKDYDLYEKGYMFYHDESQ